MCQVLHIMIQLSNSKSLVLMCNHAHYLSNPIGPQD